MIFIKVIKKNQIIVFILALVLVTAGYMSYKPGTDTELISTTLDNSALADIGDAQLVSSSSIINAIEKETSNTEDEEDEALEVSADNYFAETKLERNRMYSQMLESYQNLAENPNISSAQKSIITKEVTKINNLQNSIMIAENLILNKEVEDAVILVNGDNVNVVVKTGNLSKSLVAQIQNIVTRELTAKINNIHITKR